MLKKLPLGRILEKPPLIQCVLCGAPLLMDRFTGEMYERINGIPGRHKHWCPKMRKENENV